MSMMMELDDDDYYAFPNEIISEILSYLPLKSLLRFRQVSKTWKNTIHHLLHQTPQLIKKSCFVFLKNDSRKLYIVEEDEDSLLVTSAKISWGSRPKNCDRSYSKPYNNGMFCFSSTYFNKSQPCEFRAYIYNPGTQHFHRLPNINTSSSQLNHSNLVPGVGLDLSTSQFKVVQFFDDRGEDHTDLKTEAYIHILGSNSWRKLDNVPRVVCYRGSVVVINGIVHWLTRSRRILSFDLATETFGYVRIPQLSFLSDSYVRSPYARGGFYNPRNLRLADLGGCLSLCDSEYDDHAEIWIMRDYNLREASWTKIDVAKMYVPTPELQGKMFQRVLPISILNNGEMLLLYESLVLVSYNLETKKYTPLQIRGLPGYRLSDLRGPNCPIGQYRYEVHPYSGNLLWP